jgi:predicted flap endonuclease-1-like 5' DNA nuclease
MATKAIEKVNAQNALKSFKTTASNLNKEMLKTSDDIVEGAIETGEKWNIILEKAAKKGTILFEKQQDILLDTLEGVIGQYSTGAKRFGKLIGFQGFYKRFNRATDEISKTTKEKVKETRKALDEAVKSAKKSDVVKMASEVLPNAKVKVKETRKAISEVVKPAKKSDEVKIADEVVPNAKVSVKPVLKTEEVKSVEKLDDLKVIDGIGPKLEMILQDGGIKTYEQLAEAKITTLKEILIAAGPRFKMYDPSSWRQKAELAAGQRALK